MEPHLALDVADQIATVTITNPAKRNAMTADMWRALPALFDRLAVDPAVRVVVLTGAGDTFCAGADIGNLREMGADTAQSNLAVAAEERLAAFEKPTLARITGYCVGGGCQLALACDIRFASADATFGITPAKLGIVYPVASTARLVRLVGAATAKRLLFSAELVDAATADRMRLVEQVLPVTELDAAVAAYARTLVSRSALSQQAMKEIIGMLAAGTVDADRVAWWMREVRDSGEAAEGASAFLERREPRWVWAPR